MRIAIWHAGTLASKSLAEQLGEAIEDADTTDATQVYKRNIDRDLPLLSSDKRELDYEYILLVLDREVLKNKNIRTLVIQMLELYSKRKRLIPICYRLTKSDVRNINVELSEIFSINVPEINPRYLKAVCKMLQERQQKIELEEFSARSASAPVPPKIDSFDDVINDIPTQEDLIEFIPIKERVTPVVPTPAPRREEEHEEKCIICWTERPNMTFDDCGHVMYCDKCYEEKIKECPACRKPIIKAIKCFYI